LENYLSKTVNRKRRRVNELARAARIAEDILEQPIDGAKVKIRDRPKTDLCMTKAKTKLKPVPNDEANKAAEPAPAAALDPTYLRVVEALLFAAAEPLAPATLAAALPNGTDVSMVLSELQSVYEGRGVNLANIAGKWQFRTAKDLGFLLHKEKTEERRLSRAAIETLAIIAYHQPATRAEIEDIRGVMVSKGTVDALMEVGWVRIRGRKRTPGRPVTYGTTEGMLVHFGLESVSDLPGLEELRGAGFLEAAPPAGFEVPNPSDELAADEDPYVEQVSLLPDDMPPNEDP
jgi:segregation and condensation protein B